METMEALTTRRDCIANIMNLLNNCDESEKKENERKEDNVLTDERKDDRRSSVERRMRGKMRVNRLTRAADNGE